MEQFSETGNLCRGAGGLERTAVTLRSSLQWRQYEEPRLRAREPGQEAAPGAGEATFAGERQHRSRGMQHEKAAGHIISRGRGYAGTWS